jgi:hypothetical protein
MSRLALLCHCPDCGTRLRVDNPTARTYTAVCPDCYDGTEDSGPLERVMGVGLTPDGARRAFHERRLEI